MANKTVTITKNAKLQRDGDGLYWLQIESSKGSAMFKLVSDIEYFEEVLDQFMEEQEQPMIDSQN